jgi:hypothetical protein
MYLLLSPHHPALLGAVQVTIEGRRKSQVRHRIRRVQRRPSGGGRRSGDADPIATEARERERERERVI